MSERRSKYGNRKTEVDGFVFDSKREANRYSELKLREKAGEIFDLELQPKFECIVHGEKICTYIADFRYKEYPSLESNSPVRKSTYRTVVEDSKGVKTDVYRLKKKLVHALFAVDVVEV